MQISCPACTTNFSVPDKALQPKGRTLKCAKCGHKWFQDPPGGHRDFGLDATAFPPPPPRPEPFRSFNPVRDPDPDLEFETPTQISSASRASADLDFDLDSPPIPNLGQRVGSDDRPMDFDLDPDSAPQPVPSMFANPPEKKGTGGLWFLLLLLLLGGAAGAGYYYQDRVIDLIPEAHDWLSKAGLRHEKPGAGLELRNAGTPERFVHNDTEVLIVRGIIANVTDRTRAVPTMKLVLLDKDKHTVQEKMNPPPVTSLDPGATSGFRIILERPDPNAVEVNVLFVETVDPGAK
jgi:predicted Zn finger-like uncharacterized protein